jgi:hypothetical protein
MLKLALVENLRRLADELLSARNARHAADRYVSRAGEPHGRRIAARRPPTGPLSCSCFIAFREYGLRLAAVRAAVDDDLTMRHTTAEEAIRPSTSGRGGAGLDGERGDESLVSAQRWTGWSTSRRSAWSNACCSGTRPACMPHGLSEPRRAARVRSMRLAEPTARVRLRVALKAV